MRIIVFTLDHAGQQAALYDYYERLYCKSYFLGQKIYSNHYTAFALFAAIGITLFAYS